jgi:hypothetical protein
MRTRGLPSLASRKLLARSSAAPAVTPAALVAGPTATNAPERKDEMFTQAIGPWVVTTKPILAGRRWSTYIKRVDGKHIEDESIINLNHFASSEEAAIKNHENAVWYLTAFEQILSRTQ